MPQKVFRRYRGPGGARDKSRFDESYGQPRPLGRPRHSRVQVAVSVECADSLGLGCSGEIERDLLPIEHLIQRGKRCTRMRMRDDFAALLGRHLQQTVDRTHSNAQLGRNDQNRCVFIEHMDSAGIPQKAGIPTRANGRDRARSAQAARRARPARSRAIAWLTARWESTCDLNAVGQLLPRNRCRTHPGR